MYDTEQKAILQVTLTPEESKRLIAVSLASQKKVKRAAEYGRIIFKGGSTVSKVSEEICGQPLSVCGYISRNGTKLNLNHSEPHITIYENGRINSLDDEKYFSDCVKLSGDDLIICGANAIDIYGNAAIMTGTEYGGGVPASLYSLFSEGAGIIIASGYEKLIPGNILEISKNTGRSKKKMSFGMSVGLVPIPGLVYTEKQAVENMAEVKATVIAAGGLFDAQGSITIDIEGTDLHINKIYDIIVKIKDTASHNKNSYDIKECKFSNSNCKDHKSCIYKIKLLSK